MGDNASSRVRSLLHRTNAGTSIRQTGRIRELELKESANRLLERWALRETERAL